MSATTETLEHWKQKAINAEKKLQEEKEEFEEYRISSQQLEEELESQIEASEKQYKELKLSHSRQQDEIDRLKERLDELQRTSCIQVTELGDELAKVISHRDEIQKYIRELEQSNDDLERAKRNAIATINDFEQRLNTVVERNAILECELDEKEELNVVVQRLKDEARDLRQELAVKSKNQHAIEPKKPTIVPAQNSTPNSSTLSQDSLNNRFHNSGRISALNIVSDLLHKVGALESKLSSCKKFNDTARKRTHSTMYTASVGYNKNSNNINNNSSRNIMKVEL